MHTALRSPQNSYSTIAHAARLDGGAAENYDTILIPTFKTSDMTKRQHPDKGTRRKINSKTARSMLTMRHFNFRTYLQHKGIMLGCEVVTVGEHNTSITCGVCGCINEKLGSSETFTCPSCGNSCDRDEHASRNIFIKHLTVK